MDNFRGQNRNLCLFINFHASLRKLAVFFGNFVVFLVLNLPKSWFSID
jgi:hypothetical protein